MSRCIRRRRHFDIVLLLKNNGFLSAPREDQCNWIINPIIKFAAHLFRAYPRLLCDYTTSFKLSQVKDGKIPDDVREPHWPNGMVIVQAIKQR